MIGRFLRMRPVHPLYLASIAAFVAHQATLPDSCACPLEANVAPRPVEPLPEPEEIPDTSIRSPERVLAAASGGSRVTQSTTTAVEWLSPVSASCGSSVAWDGPPSF
jgi:hypothetical protein